MDRNWGRCFGWLAGREIGGMVGCKPTSPQAMQAASSSIATIKVLILMAAHRKGESANMGHRGALLRDVLLQSQNAVGPRPTEVIAQASLPLVDAELRHDGPASTISTAEDPLEEESRVQYPTKRTGDPTSSTQRRAARFTPLIHRD